PTLVVRTKARLRVGCLIKGVELVVRQLLRSVEHQSEVVLSHLRCSLVAVRSSARDRAPISSGTPSVVVPRCPHSSVSRRLTAGAISPRRGSTCAPDVAMLDDVDAHAKCLGRNKSSLDLLLRVPLAG